MWYTILFVTASALILGAIKKCDPSRHPRSIHRHHRNINTRHWE